jgi:hypothetical protein
VIAPTRRGSLLAVLALLAASAALAMTIGVQQAQSASYKPCSLSEREQDPPGTRPTYNLSLKQQHTTCATAKKVMKAFHACRPSTSYRCTKKVLARWTCSGRKDSSTALIFYGSFTCTWGKRRVQSSYQQNT